ncbi:uncharacterized protein [Clytia hemisphaerica]|uniref:uncharacterized protein n=1 Tax=Clytia hemisphaerica TaxID=252671 RepID=UPI0034D3F632
MAAMLTVQQKLLNLQPKAIDSTKCSPDKSLHQQVLRNFQMVSDRQVKQFNLGNTQTFTDPIKAADYLLEREYGETSLFDPAQHEPVFIPPVFCSNQYTKKSPVALLDYDIEKQCLETLDNLTKGSPNYWFTEQLQTFIQNQGMTSETVHQINAADFTKWLLNVKITHLVANELSVNSLTLPPSMSEHDVFLKGCIAELRSKSTASQLQTTLQSCLLKFPSNGGKKNLKREVEKLVEQNPPQDSNLLWFFELQLSERGEEIEHTIFDRFLSMKEDSVLNDTVILQSVCFLTDVKKKKHQEFDLVIFSWSRKLVIGIEMKRQLTDTAFEQTEKYHRLFEKRLGDQFGDGWTFVPIICVEKNTETFESLHYISINTDIKMWLSAIFNKFPEKNSQIPFLPPIEQLKSVLRLIVFAIHISKKDQIAPITTTSWVKYISDAIDSVCTSHNILFHSKEQLPALTADDPKYKKVVLKGGYGTGKSFLLQQKAIMLSKDPYFSGYVMYICGKSLFHFKSTLLYWRTVYDLQKYNVHVEGNLNWDLLEGMKKMEIAKRPKAFLIDEFQYETSTLNELLDIADVIWIALDAQFQEMSIESFTGVNLNKNLRNSGEIVLEAEKKIAHDIFGTTPISMPPKNFPRGCRPITVDSLDEGVDKAREMTSEGILVISSFDITNGYKIMSGTNNGWEIKEFNAPYSPYEYLLKGGILMAGWSKWKGFEWPTVVVGNRGNHHDKSNLYMRCTTNLIIVCDDINNV